MDISEKLSNFIFFLQYKDIPESIRSNALVRILDIFSSAAAGYRVNREACDIVRRVFSGLESRGRSSLLFANEKLSAPLAASYNTFLANSADMDDGHMLANGHPGITTIPPVLALAEANDISFETIITAITAGYEVYIRMSRAIMPSHLARGFNGTGTVGTIAAAAASSKALGLNECQIQKAMGLAAASAAGLMELNKTGQEMKPMIPANAVRQGMMCALYAQAGAAGPEEPFEGKNGFFKAFADEIDLNVISDGLGSQLLMDTAYIKLYPACRHMHAMIDCASIARARDGFSLNNIHKIRLYTYPSSVKLTGAIKHPKNGAEAKFSLTYSTAVALKNGGYALDDLTSEDQKDPVIKELIDKMEIIVDPSLENRAQMIRGAKLEIIFNDGSCITEKVDVPKGEKAYPAEETDYKYKFVTCMHGLLPEEKSTELFERLIASKSSEDIRYCMNMTKEV